METVQTLRGQIIAVPVKEKLQSKFDSFKGALKNAGLLKSSEPGYGQMAADASGTTYDADGQAVIKEQHTYEDDTCRGRCMYYACCRCSKRYYTACLSSLGFLITFGIRCNMSWAMLSMIARHNQTLHEQAMSRAHHLQLRHGADGVDHVVDLVGIINVTTKPDFYWTAKERGLVDGSFFFGYLVTQIPGGVIASKFAANKVFGVAVGGSALINLFIPWSCKAHYILVMILRTMQGLVEGTSYPACHGIWRFWAPPLERSRLATIAFCGSYAGAVFGLSLSGLLAQNLGWQSPFYFYGISGMFWFVWWWRVTYERPAIHPTITEAERVYIETSIGDNPNVLEHKIPIPWRQFFVSLPVWAIIVANFARSWSFYLLIMKTPKYFKEVFGYNMAEIVQDLVLPIQVHGACVAGMLGLIICTTALTVVIYESWSHYLFLIDGLYFQNECFLGYLSVTGFLSALPHLVMAIIVPLGGQLADRLRKNTLSTTTVRKLFNCGGFGMEAVFLLGVGCSKTTTSALACLVLAVGFSGFAISGYNVNHLDIAPRYASILMGLSNGVGTISGMICPLTAELLTQGGRKEGWTIVFVIASMVHFTGVIFYAIFASGEKQPWAEVPDEALSNWQPPTDLPPDGEKGFATHFPAQHINRPLEREDYNTYDQKDGMREYGYDQSPDARTYTPQNADPYHQGY
ncbi:hypothetical protein T265_03619 [Opisthorchis viverrini]|uniref:Major facilitator superfamily (MFS) profile domain-containing protein n=1 Tax=Opisthorchis viverrini TaxID=6198 RepID=A0A075AHG1_OPIVI|nr:hypothetical protein T265_03619 [Opisthorchis viverrini]KER29824.1 hypothetical protein T265_03619 [Opisthorchis viverrini]